MRAIEKGNEPIALAQYRSQPGAVYDGPLFTDVKSRIRDQLLAEQGYLCAYCMQRIDAASMKVDHWRCQGRYPSSSLEYSNMLGCCMGNEGQPLGDAHCDTRKGDEDISFNPSNPDDHQKLKIRYAGDGTIGSEDEVFDKEINNILNLNWVRIKDNRKAVLKAVTGVLAKGGGTRTRPEIQRLIKRWKTPDKSGHLPEYCGVAVYYLEKRPKAVSQKQTKKR
ncbi:MAG: TIGR02646 family protein [Desulfatibacillaceae bacterium]|nr:TIGR02646 family protein [Desulfatibacillaceae bacterium]